MWTTLSVEILFVAFAAPGASFLAAPGASFLAENVVVEGFSVLR